MMPPAPTRIVCARDTGEVVVFGQPEAREAGGLGMLCQIERVGQRNGRCEAFADIREIKYRELHHGRILARARRHASGINIVSSGLFCLTIPR
jgi:hypothetical protein